MNKPVNGAKQRMRNLQRKAFEDFCCECGDTVDTAAGCATCGQFVCRDCKMDHNCLKEDGEMQAPPTKG